MKKIITTIFLCLFATTLLKAANSNEFSVGVVASKSVYYERVNGENWSLGGYGSFIHSFNSLLYSKANLALCFCRYVDEDGIWPGHIYEDGFPHGIKSLDMNVDLWAGVNIYKGWSIITGPNFNVHLKGKYTQYLKLYKTFYHWTFGVSKRFSKIEITALYRQHIGHFSKWTALGSPNKIQLSVGYVF